MKEGWILLHRSILETKALKDDWEMLSWVKILLHVNYKDIKTMINGKEIVIHRGECSFSYRTWAKVLKCSAGKIQNFFKSLVREKMISLSTFERRLILKVENYDKYQKNTQSNTLNLQNNIGLTDNTNTQPNTQSNSNTLLNTQKNTQPNTFNLLNNKGLNENANTQPNTQPNTQTHTELNNILNNNKNIESNNRANSQKKLIDENHELQNYILENCSRIQKMEQQLTYTQAIKLEQDFDANLVTEVIDSLENYKDKKIEKSYKSVYLTLRKWIKKEIKDSNANSQSNRKQKYYSGKNDDFTIEGFEELIRTTTK